MAGSVKTGAITRCTLVLPALLALFFVQDALCSLTALPDCKKQNMEAGLEICRDAFTASFEEHLEELKEAPKRKGCCLSYSLRTCLELSYKAAQCDPTEQDIKMMEEEMVEKQKYINKAASYLGTILCGEVKREHCGERLLHRFNEALKNITQMNGANNLRPSVFPALIAAIVGALHILRWI